MILFIFGTAINHSVGIDTYKIYLGSVPTCSINVNYFINVVYL